MTNPRNDIGHEMELDPLCTQMTAETFSDLVTKSATKEELNAVSIANLVTESPNRILIIKKIVYDMILNGSAMELEDAINAAVSNHRDVHELHSTYLDIAMRDQNHGT